VTWVLPLVLESKSSAVSGCYQVRRKFREISKFLHLAWSWWSVFAIIDSLHPHPTQNMALNQSTADKDFSHSAYQYKGRPRALPHFPSWAERFSFGHWECKPNNVDLYCSSHVYLVSLFNCSRKSCRPTWTWFKPTGCILPRTSTKKTYSSSWVLIMGTIVSYSST